ncbi:YgaP family membrane protein [Vibrio sp. RC27]
MNKNVGGIDKTLRIIAGIVLLALTFVLANENGLWLWGLIGIIPLATGLLSRCPIYPLLGFSSCPLKRSE